MKAANKVQLRGAALRSYQRSLKKDFGKSGHLVKTYTTTTRSTKPNHVGPVGRKTKEQKHAALFLELYGIVHFLLTKQRCPVMFNGKLAYVACPGVSKEAFKLAIDDLVVRNLVAYCKANPPNALGLTPAKRKGKRNL